MKIFALVFSVLCLLCIVPTVNEADACGSGRFGRGPVRSILRAGVERRTERRAARLERRLDRTRAMNAYARGY